MKQGVKLDVSSRTVYIVLGLVTFLLFAKLLVPYYQHSIYQWDAAGHALAAEFVKDKLFPGMIGWNNNGYMGFPHNQFYSPLFSWLVALFGWIFGVERSFRLIVSLSVLALPWCFYLLGRGFNLDKNKSLFFTLLAVAFLCFPSSWFSKYEIGGNFDSLFKVGLVSNALGFVFLLLYMSFLKKIEEKRFFILESILLPAVVLTSMVNGVVAVIYSIAFFIGEYSNQGKGKTWIKHYFLAFLLTAYWSVPFLAKIGLSNSAFIPLIFNTQFFVTILLCCGALFFLYYKGDNSIVHANVFLALLLGFIFAVNLFQISFHAYRMLIFAYIFAILVFAKTISTRKAFIYIAFSLLLFCLFSYTNYNLLDKKYEIPIQIDAEGRSLIVTTFNTGYNVQFLEHMIPKWNPKIEGISYIYVESALNAKEVNTLKKLAVSNGFVWGTTWGRARINMIPAEEKHIWFDRAAWLFGLNNVITHAESSSINWTLKKEIFKDEIGLFHKVSFIDGEIFYYEGDNIFLISKKTGKLFLTTQNINYFINITQNKSFYFKEGILRDEILICDKDNFYFLKKNPVLEFNSFDYTARTNLDVQKMTGTKVICEDGKRFPSLHDINYSAYYTYTGVPLVKIENREIKQANVNYQKTWDLRYNIYYLNESFSEKIDLIKEDVEFIDIGRKEWNNFSYKWFLGENFFKLYSRGEMPDGFKINTDAKIEDIKFERENIKFSVNSNEKAAVLVKVSYFPNWKAYANGKRTEIYEISPHLMMIYGKGELELRYRKTWSDLIGILGSIAGLAWLISVLIQRKNEKK